MVGELMEWDWVLPLTPYGTCLFLLDKFMTTDIQIALIGDKWYVPSNVVADIRDTSPGEQCGV